jgi:hypothetical protein
MDRLFTYNPNCFALLSVAVAAGAVRGSVGPIAVALPWVFASTPWASLSWHVAEWRRLLWPPELRVRHY